MQDYQALHRRYMEQARWTSQVRRRLYAHAGLSPHNSVIEVGCGTGAICRELPAFTSGLVLGLDLDPAALALAAGENPAVEFLLADGFRLPLVGRAVDAVLCHFLLLWVGNPLAMLIEMVRVTRSGGAVMALAEPDYGGRIDYPDFLKEMGELQRQALRDKGADPLMGRQLRALFHQAGLGAVHVGVLGGEWDDRDDQQAFASEWETWRGDLSGRLSEAQLGNYRSRAEAAWRSGGQVLFVPTFYAFGRVP
jgi:SAM-dependent methyltransferase